MQGEGWDLAEKQLGRKVAGKLRLERVLGVGGMGAVYEAVNEATQRRFAVKLVHPEVTRDPAGRERIAREATAPNEIGHPGLVAVYDAGTDTDGTVYLCMELLEGSSLRDWLRRPKATVGTAIEHVREALEPLGAAHAKGFVHRDLKPENLFLTKDGVKLLDFGLVRRADATSASITGTAIGTVHYMSPEQARGSAQTSAAADVWSVGVLLYELASGRRPFEGDSALDVMMKAASEPHAPLTGVPPKLVAVIDACLAKDPSARPPDAKALEPRLAAALDELRESPLYAQALRGGERDGSTAQLGVGVAPTAALPPPPSEADFVEMKIPSSSGRMLKLALAGLALLLVAGAVGLGIALTHASYDPTHIALGATGGGNELDRRLLDGFEAELRRFGFLVTRAEGLGGDGSAALRERARETGAGHAVLLDVTSVRVRDGMTSETAFFRQGLTVRLVDTESGTEVAAHELVYGHEALTGSEVAQELLSSWIHSLGPLLVESLYARDNVREAMQSSTDVQIAARALELTANQSDVTTIRDTRAQLVDRCRELGEALDAANASSTPRVQCYGDPCGETYLLGLTPDGRSAIVQVESPRPFVNFQAELRLAQTEERIERVPLEGGEPVVLATAANYYGVGALAPGGTGVAVLEQGRGENLGVVGVDAASGVRRVQAVLGPRRAPDAVLPSPDGRTALVLGYGQGVMVRDGRERRVALGALSGPRWVALPALGVPHVVATYARWSDQLALVQEDGATAIAPVSLVGRFVGVAGARDGLLHLVVSDAAGCHHARFDPVQAAMVSVTPMSDCIAQPSLTSDGRLIGIASVTGPDDTPGDPEIVMVDPDDGHVRPLSRGTFREVNPQVAPNGSRVAFERHLEPPEGLGLGVRSVVCWLDP